MSDKIIFIGVVEGHEKQQLLAQSYFTFLISESENFGNVVIESLAQGTPVIASKGTPWQKLPDNNAGYWIDNSQESLIETIESIIQIPESQYATMRSSARAFCESEFDVHKNIGTWIKEYQQVYAS
jgi:glycosyltransferase involved in cell wall biosynthesis